MRHCENMTVNTVLTVYERRAKEGGIPVKISAKVSRDVTVLPQDLVIVIANLFENAINASSKLKTEEKSIDISSKETAQRLLIKVENPCKEKLIFAEKIPSSAVKSYIPSYLPVVSITERMPTP